MAKRWTVRRYDQDLARFIARSVRVSDLIAAMLVCRGIETPEAAKRFLSSSLKDDLRDPLVLPGCQSVAERLWHAVQNRKKIAVYGDYDVDGITGTVILYQTIRELGGDVSYFVPSRFDEGYGLHSDTIRRLAREEKVNVIVTVDCGITSVDEALVAKECGVSLLITDHHIPLSELPDVEAIAHPQLVTRSDGVLCSPRSLSETELKQATRYPFEALCGSMVAFKVAWALGQLAAGGADLQAIPKFRHRLKQMIGLAALGTIADVVPLRDENRALVRSGLEFLKPEWVSPGLRELYRVVKFDENKTALDSEFAAFQLIPRLNAAGRMGQACLAVELLLSDNPSRVAELADYIDALNDQRKTLENRILKEAVAQIENEFDPADAAFVLNHNDWHKGVVGIVASRVVDRYHRPVVLLTRHSLGRESSLTGSARSVPGFNLCAALEACSEFLVKFGGHDAAAGLTVEEKMLVPFREAFCEKAAERISAEERTGEIFIDGDFPLGAFTRQTVSELSLLAPFGAANIKPIFSSHGVSVTNIKSFGKEDAHFSAEFQHGETALRGIAFHRKDWL